MALKFLLVFLGLAGFARADWIDPETPNASLVTEAYTVHPPPKPTPAPSIIYDDDFYVTDDRLMHHHKGNSTWKPKRLKPTKKP